MSRAVYLPLVLCSLCVCVNSSRGEFTLVSRFDPDQGTLVGMGFDPTTDTIWTYSSSGSLLRNYNRAGSLLASINRPGESANDFDITFAPKNLTLGATAVAEGTLLAINGETGTADIYAVDKATGAVIASLATAFGASHVVGGAYHPLRNTFFIVQDRRPSNTSLRSLIAEIDPVTGSVLNTFGTSSADYTVDFGDLEISGVTGNLMLVSSDEGSVRELTPLGVFVQDHALPSGVSSLSGLALDASRGQGWVSSTGGTVSLLGGFPQTAAVPEPSSWIMLGVGVLTLAARGRFARRI